MEELNVVVWVWKPFRKLQTLVPLKQLNQLFTLWNSLRLFQRDVESSTALKEADSLQKVECRVFPPHIWSQMNDFKPSVLFVSSSDVHPVVTFTPVWRSVGTEVTVSKITWTTKNKWPQLNLSLVLLLVSFQERPVLIPGWFT